jgi:hypothetical protein
MRDEKRRSIPVIIFLGMDGAGAVKGKLHGAYRVVAKPCVFEKLLGSVRQVLDDLGSGDGRLFVPVLLYPQPGFRQTRKERCPAGVFLNSAVEESESFVQGFPLTIIRVRAGLQVGLIDLLNRRRGSTSTESSNLSPSASPKMNDSCGFSIRGCAFIPRQIPTTAHFSTAECAI